MATPNQLIHSKSPYLLQHAYNPVNWQPWSEEAFARARTENKLVLVSIGYSSCHWCHVMEHECFENEETATLMNRHFINIKVDREERPDIDNVYMTAVQLMSGHGGWPLNCFVLPDGRPIYGGTYFPKQRWDELLKNLAAIYNQNPEKTETYAGELTQGIKQVNEYFIRNKEQSGTIDHEDLQAALAKWEKRFDKKEGGNAGAPKFPMPNNYLFLLHYGYLAQNEVLLEQVHLTLRKMAEGGIYDQLGGGFARYSTDPIWKVPHFEKMLYDNAQLVTLYSAAYRHDPQPLYKQVVYETLAFIEREMTSKEGGFYSALDADSEGKEGMFYVWTKEEIEHTLTNDHQVFCDYYSVNETGYWEDDQYILLRSMPEEALLKKYALTPDKLNETIKSCKEKLLEVRSKRESPGLDDKVIASWNGAMCRGLVEAYTTFGEARFLEMAERNAAFIAEHLMKEDGSLFRCAKGSEGYGGAFLDDHSFIIDCFIGLFCATGKEDHLKRALQLTDLCFDHFFDTTAGLFSYSPAQGEALVAGHYEVNDNVIPASNSQMALNLQNLYALTANVKYEQTAAKMLAKMQSEVLSAPSSHSNWGLALLRNLYPFYEICIVGKTVDEFMARFAKHFLPNAIFVFSNHPSSVPLLQGRFSEAATQVFVCSNKTCQSPVSTIEEALKQIKWAKVNT